VSKALEILRKLSKQIHVWIIFGCFLGSGTRFGAVLEPVRQKDVKERGLVKILEVILELFLNFLETLFQCIL